MGKARQVKPIRKAPRPFDLKWRLKRLGPLQIAGFVQVVDLHHLDAGPAADAVS